MITSSLILNSNTTVLTASAPLATTVLWLANFSTNQIETVQIYLVKSGDAAGTSNIIVPDGLVPQKDGFRITEKFLLDTGDQIIISGAIGNIVTATVSYILL